MGLALNQIAAVVLAGGFGTRIRHLLPDLPKPMAPVAGRPFVEWVVRYLARHGVRKVIISTGYLAEKIHDHFTAASFGSTTVMCVPETTPLGTAGGFLHCTGTSGERPAGWLVLNGDSLLLTPLDPLSAALDSGSDAALLGLTMADTARYGTLEMDQTGNLIRFAEKKPGAGVINAGVYLFSSELLAQFPATRPLSFETEVFPSLLASGARIRVVTADGPFLDIGTESSLCQAEGFILQNQDHFYIEPA